MKFRYLKFYTAKVPLTLICATVIIVFNYNAILGLPEPFYWKMFACNPDSVLKGELWRLLSSFLPHGGLQHLIEDVLYFLVVAGIAELIFGWRYTLIILTSCELASSFTCITIFGRDYYGIGSSAATHGLLACISIYLAICGKDIFLQILCVSIFLYLLYLSIYAIYYGVMGWPLTMLANIGWDHLGGVSAGGTFGFIKASIQRPKKQILSYITKDAHKYV